MGPLEAARHAVSRAPEKRAGGASPPHTGCARERSHLVLARSKWSRDLREFCNLKLGGEFLSFLWQAARPEGVCRDRCMLIFEKNKLILAKVQSWVDQLWRAAEFVVDKDCKNLAGLSKCRVILHARCKMPPLVDKEFGSSPQLVDP